MEAGRYNNRLTAQLLSLVRASLWSRPADEELFGDVDWEALRDLSFRQTVAMLVCDGSLSLPQELRPPKEWQRSAYVYLERNRLTHRLVNKVLTEAVTKLEAADVSPVLLKGQAYAQYYPQPLLRQCGDIDLYVGADDYLIACQTAIDDGWECKGSPETSGKHFVSSMGGIFVELHRSVLTLPSSRATARFNDWSHAQLRSGTQKLLADGVAVSQSTPIFDMVYSFLHLYHHFLAGGVGLRQLCDWVMLLNAHSTQIDRDELRLALRDFGALKAWQIFTPIAVDYLGLEESRCPFYDGGLREKADKILDIIIAEGNFGKFAPTVTPRPAGYFPGKLHSFLAVFRRMFKLLPIDTANVLRNYRSYLVAGLTQVAKDIVG